MKRIIQLFLPLMLPLCGFGADGFVIKGKVTGILNGFVEVLPLSKLDKEAIPFPPKVKIVNGEFTYAGYIERPQVVNLKISTKQVRLLLENARYTVNCSFDSLHADQVKGGKMNAQYRAFGSSGMSPVEYLQQHVGEEFSAWMAYTFIKEKTEVEIVEKLLTISDKVSPNGKLFMKRVEALNKVAPGVPFPPVLKLVDANGKPFQMKDMAGKFVVLDFWASWCPPCIAFIPKLREHYNAYKDKNVEFVSVSVDESVDKWKGAMEGLHMEWKQVLAEGAFKSGEGVRAMLNINTIPYLIVVDKEGKIAALLNFYEKEKMGEVLGNLVQ